MMDWNDSWGAGDWVAMTLMMLLFWGVLIGLVVWLVVAYLRRTDSPTTSGSDADRILAGRYARGEIDEDELTRRRAVLHGGPAGSPVSSDPGDVGRRVD